MCLMCLCTTQEPELISFISLSDGREIFVVNLRDRRTRRAESTTWVFFGQLERFIFGGEASNGALHRLMERQSLTRTLLPLKKASIGASLVTAEEFGSMLEVYTTDIADLWAKVRASVDRKGPMHCNPFNCRWVAGLVVGTASCLTSLWGIRLRVESATCDCVWCCCISRAAFAT